MIKRYFTKFMLFLSVSFTAAAIGNTQEPLNCLFSVCFPYHKETGNVLFSYFSLNICLCLIFVSSIIQSVDEQFMLSNYILTRTNRKRALNIMILRTASIILILTAIKLVADLLFGNLNKTLDLYYLFCVVISIVLTLLIWMLLCYLLTQKRISIRNCYCLVMLLIVLSQFIVNKLPVLTLFVFGSESLSKESAIWLICKALVVICLYILNLLSFKKYEHLKRFTEV